MSDRDPFHYLADGLRVLDYAEARGSDKRVARQLFERLGAEKTLAHLREEGHRYQAMPVAVPAFPVRDVLDRGPLRQRAQELRGSPDAWEQLAKAHWGDQEEADRRETDGTTR